jgi:hypothetical protein
MTEQWFLADDEDGEMILQRRMVDNDGGPGDADYGVMVYVTDRTDDPADEQIARLVALLNRVAPDGVIPAPADAPDAETGA